MIWSGSTLQRLHLSSFEETRLEAPRPVQSHQTYRTPSLQTRSTSHYASSPRRLPCLTPRLRQATSLAPRTPPPPPALYCQRRPRISRRRRYPRFETRSAAVSIISLNGKASLTRRTHGNPSPIFLHAGSSRNFIVAILGNPESLVISFLLFCWISSYGFIC